MRSFCKNLILAGWIVFCGCFALANQTEQTKKKCQNILQISARMNGWLEDWKRVKAGPLTYNEAIRMARESLELRRTMNRQALLGNLDPQEATVQLTHYLRNIQNRVATGARTRSEAVQDLRGYFHQITEVFPEFIAIAQLKYTCVRKPDPLAQPPMSRPSAR